MLAITIPWVMVQFGVDMVVIALGENSLALGFAPRLFKTIARMIAEPMPTKPLLSPKNIPVRERLIFALDVPIAEARTLVKSLGDSVHFYKLGLQIFMSGDYFGLVDWLRQEQNKRVFVDLKFFDVPETVKSAVTQLRNRN